MELNLFENKKEYRIPERDIVPSGKLLLKNGTLVIFDKYVYRVGYELHPKSYSISEWNQVGFDIVCDKTGLDKEVIRKVIDALNLFFPYKGLRKEIFNILVGSKIKGTVQKRSMWFKDHNKDRVYEIMGSCRKQTGVYVPGYRYECGQYGDIDYYPPYLGEYVNQNLYLAKPFGSKGEFPLIVHPWILENMKENEI